MIKSTGDPEWRRAPECAAGSCVEVAKVADRYLIRDSKNPEAGVLSFSEAEWNTFVGGVKAGAFRFD
jgi:hypothetical protein